MRSLFRGKVLIGMKRITPAQIAELEENAESYAKLKNEVIYSGRKNQ